MNALTRAYAKAAGAPPSSPSSSRRRPAAINGTARRLAARKLARGVYDGTESSRQTADWNPGTQYPTPLTADWLELLRNRSRSLARTASHVVSAFTAIKDNVIGADGFRVRPRPLLDPNDPDAVDEPLARRLAAIWKDHAAGIDKDRRESLTDLLRLALGEYPEAGEAFLVESTAPPGDAGIVPQVVEVIAAERCDHGLTSLLNPPRNMRAGNTITNGIEFDRFGRRVAYHFNRVETYGIPAIETERIDVARVHHLFHRLRAGQERGLPWLYASTMLAHDLDDLIDSELTSAQVAACLAAFIKTESGAGVFEDSDVERDEDDDRPIIGLDPGMVAYLQPGEEVDSINPSRPAATFEPFAGFLIRQLAKSLGPSYETVSGDYRRVNYASGRLAHLIERKAYRRIQGTTISLVVAPLYRSFVRRGTIAGRLPISPFDYLANPRRYDRVEVQAPGWEHHDPLKEATAAALRILVGLSTLDEEAAALGRDWRMNIEQRSREVEAMEAAGLIQFSVTPATPINTGGATAPTAEQLQRSAKRLGFKSAAELIDALEDGALRTFDANGGRLAALNGDPEHGTAARR